MEASKLAPTVFLGGDIKNIKSSRAAKLAPILYALPNPTSKLIEIMALYSASQITAVGGAHHFFLFSPPFCSPALSSQLRPAAIITLYAAKKENGMDGSISKEDKRPGLCQEPKEIPTKIEEQQQMQNIIKWKNKENMP
jgi:hypothetical protein